MPPLNLDVSPDEALQSLDLVSKEKGNTFRIKITRQDTRGNQVPSLPWAIFDGCTVEQLTEREIWLDMLIGREGGGFFVTTVYHTSDLRTPLAALKHEKNGGEGKPPCLDAIRTPGWKGPTLVQFPARTNGDNRNITLLPPAAPSQAAFRDPLGGMMPLVPNMQQAAPTAPVATAAQSSLETEQYKRNVALQESLERQKRELEQDRHKAEIESRDRAWQMKLAEMQSETNLKIAALSQVAVRPVEKAPTFLDQLPGIAAALGPFVIPLISGMMSKSEKAESEARAAQERMLTMQRDSTTQMLDLMKATRTDNTEVNKAQAEAMGAMVGMMVQTVHTLKELNQSEPESPWVSALRELSGPLGAIGEAYVKSKNTKRPAVAVAPPSMEAKILPAAPAAPAQQSVDVVEQLITAIKAHHDPRQVAGYFCEAVQQRDRGLLTALQAHGGDPEKLIQAHLGGWALSETANLEYLQRLGKLVEQEAQNRGLIPRTDGTKAATAPAQQNGAAAPIPAPTAPAQSADGAPTVQPAQTAVAAPLPAKLAPVVAPADPDEEDDGEAEEDDAADDAPADDAEDEQEAEENNKAEEK